MVKVNINGISVTAPEGATILDAAKIIHINIPTLCYMNMSDGESINCKGTCRVCMVEIEGYKDLKPACSFQIKEGMNIFTNSEKAVNARKTIIKLLLSNHPNDCLNCAKNLNCELQKIASFYGIKGVKIKGEEIRRKLDRSTPVIRDEEKCILCRRCVTACSEVQNVNILTPAERGFNSFISTFNEKLLDKSECTYCGQCVAVCPTGALTERMDYNNLENYLKDKNKYVAVQIAPSVRIALCEEFGVTKEVLTTKKIVTALRYLGFNKVFDTNFGADLTIMEEAEELIERIKCKENLPMFTSCCPAWVRLVETKYTKYTNLLSSCKSPQQMFGAIAKAYLPQKLQIDTENLIISSVMPCTAKKYEAEREEMKDDVDVVITTRELAKLIRKYSIDILDLDESEFDSPLGKSSGAGMLFGSSGGVMEAALRTAYEKLSGKPLEKLDFLEIRGLKGIKEATIKIEDKELKVAAVSSLKNAQKIIESVINGEKTYDFIEVMACPGGCINGGGQPYIQSDRIKIEKRMKSVHEIDENTEIRKCHENPEIKEVYEEYLGKPNSRVAHEILHTKYGNN
ncbi:NADH-dependent [FeFe] hydrogenase, group A6 [Clostridium sp. SHJSY1]|uniref:NADH-dependent [FeFe] hydrogenase, group A6 n=1 Tax=Clostridium sp. SHJSY1 TaxID=2942483 RepID=UPI002874A3D0|nr:NADH-dependent [FeFe] hydrogenase, group A6 [Clostridium sp. SHJSY1]MDS0525221.1 NADH-dependent [FeFe] hydrogenase, group A6 [Clostridium sp. SHJSY1]